MSPALPAISGTACAHKIPPPLHFPGDKWRLPVPRKLEVYWGNQHGGTSSQSAVSSPLVAQRGLRAAWWGWSSPLRTAFPQTTTEAIGWSMAKPSFRMLRGLLRLKAFSPTPGPAPAHMARTGRWCPREVSAGVYSPSLRTEPLGSLPLLRRKVETTLVSVSAVPHRSVKWDLPYLGPVSVPLT